MPKGWHSQAALRMGSLTRAASTGAAVAAGAVFGGMLRYV